jgi:glucose-1-phosphate thymidylyltransferase
MKGVILAGGTGSRLQPLTSIVNKHMLPVGKKPMILHPVDSMVQSGIDDILVITGPNHIGQIGGLLGSGDEFKCSITLRVQDRPAGIADALRLCKQFVSAEKFVMILGDNIFEMPIKKHVERFFADSEARAQLHFAKTSSPQLYGVGEFSDGHLVRIHEKPTHPTSDLACTGLYMYDATVFEVVERVSPSRRGEMEITDVNNMLIQDGLVVHTLIDGWWQDAGTFETYMAVNRLLSERP